MLHHNLYIDTVLQHLGFFHFLDNKEYASAEAVVRDCRFQTCHEEWFDRQNVERALKDYHNQRNMCFFEKFVQVKELGCKTGIRIVSSKYDVVICTTNHIKHEQFLTIGHIVMKVNGHIALMTNCEYEYSLITRVYTAGHTIKKIAMIMYFTFVGEYIKQRKLTCEHGD